MDEDHQQSSGNDPRRGFRSCLVDLVYVIIAVAGVVALLALTKTVHFR